MCMAANVTPPLRSPAVYKKSSWERRELANTGPTVQAWEDKVYNNHHIHGCTTPINIRSSVTDFKWLMTISGNHVSVGCNIRQHIDWCMIVQPGHSLAACSQAQSLPPCPSFWCQIGGWLAHARAAEIGCFVLHL
mmetsp:Transcript_142017/g.247568  ORF Transcript_142017/g.247568 Transcript_142017/m.247568 type:complete len:135 (-) Transcript_142017:657-1061(-)